MAASVMQYNGGSSLRLTGGITKSRTKIVSRLELANPKKLKSARKMLFGPVNGEETRRIVENQLKKHAQDASTRWDFDFSTDQPIRSPQSKFVWERIPRPEDQDRLSMGAGGPVMTLSSAAHMRTIQAAALSPCSSTSSPNSSVLSSPSTSLCHSPDLDTSATTTTTMYSNGDLSSSKRMVQKKMTDFMKEKKRTNPVLATVAKKRDFAEISAATSSSSADELSHSSWTELPPAKRMRTGSAASSTSSVESS